MKKSIKNLITLSLIAMSVSSYAEDKLIVWEDKDRAFSIESAVKAFEKAYDCEVIVKEVPMPAQRETLLRLHDKKESPDIVMLASDMVSLAVEQDIIAPIDFMQIDEDKYLPNSVAAMMIDGQCYAVPKTIETLILYYNKNLLPKPLSTMTEYIELSKKLQKKGIYGLVSKWDQFYSDFGILNAYGAYVWGVDNGGILDLSDYGLDNEGALKGFEFLRSMYKDGLLFESTQGPDGYTDIYNLFISNKVAAVINGPWAAEDYKRGGLDYDVATLPMMPNGSYMTSFLGTKGYAISKWSKNHTLAEDFLHFINKPEYALIRYKESHQVPPIYDVLNDESLKNDKLVQVIAEQSSRAIPMPSNIEMQFIWTRLDDAISQIFHTDSDIKGILRKTRGLVEADIAHASK